jgi:hypothetical protein
MWARKPLDRRCRSAIGIAFTQHRVDGGSETDGKSLSKDLLSLTLGLFGEFGDVESLFPKFLDSALQLRYRRADVRQFDDVGLWGLHEPAELREVVGDLLLLAQIVGEGSDYPADERDITRFDLDAGTAGVGLNDWEQSVGCQCRRLIGFGPNDLRFSHASSLGKIHCRNPARQSSFSGAGCQPHRGVGLCDGGDERRFDYRELRQLQCAH